MMREETRRKLRDLDLAELIHYLDMQHVESQCIGMSFDERFQMMIDYLYQEKYNSKIQRLLKTAKLRLPKAEINDIHYIQRGIDKQMMVDLGTCQFMGQNTSVIFQGFTGLGRRIWPVLWVNKPVKCSIAPSTHESRISSWSMTSRRWSQTALSGY